MSRSMVRRTAARKTWALSSRASLPSSGSVSRMNSSSSGRRASSLMLASARTRSVEGREGRVARQAELVLAEEEVGEQGLDLQGRGVVAQGDVERDAGPGEPAVLGPPVVPQRLVRVVEGAPRLAGPEAAEDRDVDPPGGVEPLVEVPGEPAVARPVVRHRLLPL